MASIEIVQIMGVLYFIAALRMKVWKTSLNTFIVISGFFLITISREIEFLRDIWATYHLSIVGLIMTALMLRVVYQSINKKLVDSVCDNCFDFKRRKDDII